MKFRNVKAFRRAVEEHARRAAIKLTRRKNETTRVTIECAAVDCSWRIHGTPIGKKGITFEVRTYQPNHTCERMEVLDAVPYKWLAEKLIPLLKKDPNLTTTDLRAVVLDEHKVKPAYHQLYRARYEALKRIEAESGGPSAPPKPVSFRRKRNDGAPVLPNRCSNCSEHGKICYCLHLYNDTPLLMTTHRTHNTFS